MGILMFGLIFFFTIEEDKFCYLNQNSRPVQVFKILIEVLKMSERWIKSRSFQQMSRYRATLTVKASSVGKNYLIMNKFEVRDAEMQERMLQSSYH